MTSNRLLSLGTAMRLASLLSVVFPTLAAAQPQGMTVTTVRNGQALTPRQVALYAGTGIKTATVAANTATFAADAIDAGLDGKRGQVLIDECKNGDVRVHLVPDDPNVLPPPEEEDCDRRPAGGIVFRRGATIVIDVGRGTVADTSSHAIAADSGHPEFERVSVYALGGSNFGSFGNLSDADPTLRIRYGNAAYNQFQNDFVENDLGWGAGGGIRVGLNGRVSLDGGFVFQDLGAGELSTTGTRVNGNLLFSLDAMDQFSTRTMLAGVTFTPTEWMAVSVLGGRTWWRNQLRIVDSLLGLTPQVRLQGGDRTEARSGSDPTLAVRVAVPVFKRVHAFYQFNRTTFKGAHVADGPSALPPDITHGSHPSGLQICMSFRRR